MRYEITLISPLHIGTGTIFTKLDGAWESGRWHLVDLDKVLSAGADPDELAEAMRDRGFDWGVWLRRNRIPISQVALYSLPCTEYEANMQVREFIKNPFNEPYIPGSSIKGAIRTALLWKLMSDSPSYRRNAARYLRSRSRGKGRPRPNPKWLAQSIERQVLGEDPNHDLLRSVHVSDSTPAGLDDLEIEPVWTYTLKDDVLVKKREGNREFKIYVEWLKEETTLEFEISLDEFLFSDLAREELNFGGKREEAVRNLAEVCNGRARELINAERDFFRRHKVKPGSEFGDGEIDLFYDDLMSEMESLPQGGFLLCIGWGGGWRMKTIGDLMRDELGESDFILLRRRYRIGRRFESDLPFPKTRRADVEGLTTLGWVKIRPKT